MRVHPPTMTTSLRSQELSLSLNLFHVAYLSSPLHPILSGMFHLTSSASLVLLARVVLPSVCRSFVSAIRGIVRLAATQRGSGYPARACLAPRGGVVKKVINGRRRRDPAWRVVRALIGILHPHSSILRSVVVLLGVMSLESN